MLTCNALTCRGQGQAGSVVCHMHISLHAHQICLILSNTAALSACPAGDLASNLKLADVIACAAATAGPASRTYFSGSLPDRPCLPCCPLLRYFAEKNMNVPRGKGTACAHAHAIFESVRVWQDAKFNCNNCNYNSSFAGSSKPYGCVTSCKALLVCERTAVVRGAADDISPTSGAVGISKLCAGSCHPPSANLSKRRTQTSRA